MVEAIEKGEQRLKPRELMEEWCPPTRGAELVDYWRQEGVIGSRPDLPDSSDHGRALRAEAERRAKS